MDIREQVGFYLYQSETGRDRTREDYLRLADDVIDIANGTRPVEAPWVDRGESWD